MKQKIAVLFLLICLIVFGATFSGCSSGVVGIYVLENPTKAVYEAGQQISLDGIEVIGINADGTTRKIRVKHHHIEDKVDTLTPGKKSVVINVDGNRTAFEIYVPHITLLPQSDLKQAIQDAKSGDIIFLKAGVYQSNAENLQKYKDITVEKALTFVGESEKTIFKGNFLVGETEKIENVGFFNINFEISGENVNNLYKFEKPYQDNFITTAINAFDTKNLYVKNCKFKGFSYGILQNSAENLSVIRSTFKDIKISAIKTNENTKTTSIYKNVFMDIAENTLYVNEKGDQNYIGAIDFSFNNEENSGVIIANNTFTRIGQKTGEFECVDNYSLDAIKNDVKNLSKLSYVNNSAIIILKSSNGENLKTRGIILSFNNYGSTLNNILFGTNNQDFLNESAVIINNN